jgi:glutaminase
VAAEVVTGALAAVLDELRDRDGGALADYIPQLAAADPDRFGIAVTSVDGHRYAAGDTAVPFTVQSVSKPFVYALALADLGLDEVSRHVAAEPSGEAFNAVSLRPGSGRPANPMINVGAIVTTGLLVAATPAERLERIVAGLSAFAGRRLAVDLDVYESEAATGDRNRALAYLARAAGTLTGDVGTTVDTYFRQCAVSATAEDLAVMAATLAAGGVNPLTGVRVVPETVTEQVLAVMATCGMYDASGEWLLRVGMPAKSGVSGGVVAVSPARFGVAVFSPRVDGDGNSVRGTAALRGLSTRLGLHLMHPVGPAASTVTIAMTGRSARAGSDVLDRHGDRIAVIGARGVLDFLAAERFMHALDALVPDRPGWIVGDLTRVTRMDPVAAAMLNAMLIRLRDSGHRIAVAGGWDDADPTGGGDGPDPGGSRPWREFASADDALSWAEAGLAATI